MTDTAVKDQPEVAAPVAAEAKPAQEANTATGTTTEQSGDKKADGASEAPNGAEKSAEKKADAAPQTKGQVDRKDIKKNRKYDPSTQPVTDDPVKIRTQVEFYFSDSNLPTDKFMWENTGGEANKPMPLKTICSFKRMHKFQPYSAVVAALRESNFLEVLGEEGQEMVRRKKPYVSSTEAQKARLNATVYVKGFGEEEPSTQFDIEAFFANYGHVKMVKLRRTNDDLFKGSVFAEFESAEVADAFVKLDPPPTWKGNELLIMKKLDYLEMKNRQIKEGLIEPNTNRRPTFFEGKERGGGRGRGRGRDDRGRDGKKREEDQKNGFKNGRGRGRGGRGGRGGRNGDSNGREEKKKTEETRQNTNDVQVPTIQSTADKGDADKKNGEANGKRAREDDSAEAPPAKKVDTKAEEVTAQ